MYDYRFHQQPVAGQARKRQYWEGSFWALILGTVGLTWMYQYAPNTNITSWAKDEAEARNRRRAQGEEVEYGVNYAAQAAYGASDEDEE